MQQSFVKSKKSSKKMTMTGSKKGPSRPIKEGMKHTQSEALIMIKDDPNSRKAVRERSNS